MKQETITKIEALIADLQEDASDDEQFVTMILFVILGASAMLKLRWLAQVVSLANEQLLKEIDAHDEEERTRRN